MPTKVHTSNFSAGDVDISSSRSYTADGSDGRNVALPVGWAGTLSTRTDNDTGVITTTLAHDIGTSDTVDVYWSGGRRYGVDVTAIGANSVTIDIGSGDNLPIATTPVVVTKRVTINMGIGDSVVAIGIMLSCALGSESSSKAHVHFTDGASFNIHMDLLGNAMVFENSESSEWTDPTTVVYASNGSSTVAANLLIALLQDSTP